MAEPNKQYDTTQEDAEISLLLALIRNVGFTIASDPYVYRREEVECTHIHYNVNPPPDRYRKVASGYTEISRDDLDEYNGQLRQIFRKFDAIVSQRTYSHTIFRRNRRFEFFLQVPPRVYISNVY